VNAPPIPRFGEIAARLVDNGYQPLPIIYGEKRPAITVDWPSYAYTDGDEEIYAKCGTGLLCGRIIGLDIDVRAPALADELDAMAVDLFGVAPCRIGAAPKRLRVYAVDGDEFGKIQTRGFRLPGDLPEDKLHRVEILARGNQFVSYNRHPDTQRPSSASFRLRKFEKLSAACASNSTSISTSLRAGSKSSRRIDPNACRLLTP
jgi:hypothetical protein